MQPPVPGSAQLLGVVAKGVCVRVSPGTADPKVLHSRRPEKVAKKKGQASQGRQKLSRHTCPAACLYTGTLVSKSDPMCLATDIMQNAQESSFVPPQKVL